MEDARAGGMRELCAGTWTRGVKKCGNVDVGIEGMFETLCRVRWDPGVWVTVLVWGGRTMEEFFDIIQDEVHELIVAFEGAGDCGEEYTSATMFCSMSLHSHTAVSYT